MGAEQLLALGKQLVVGHQACADINDVDVVFGLRQDVVFGLVVGTHNIITALLAEDEPAERSLADAPDGWTVSLVPLGRCEGLEITGMKYELEKTDLGQDRVTLCVSNEVENSLAKVRLEKGRLLIIYTRD